MPAPQKAKQGVLLLSEKMGAGHAAASLAKFIEWARTPHFIITYDQSLGQVGQNLCDAVLANCERDFATLQDWFGGITPGNLPFTIRIQAGSNGASHAGCSATELFCDDFGGNNGDLENMLVVAEADEVFMASQNAGWSCGFSNGEALSRVLAAEIYPAQLNGFATGSSWLGSTRQNFVDNTDPSDTNPVSTGCGTLFINYLRFQLDIGLKPAVIAAGATFEKGFEKLTGQAGAFAPFSRLLARFFPGTQNNIQNDNPFPLLFTDHFYTTSQAEHDAAIHPAAAKFFRMFSPGSGDHFYTSSTLERDNAFVSFGYRFEGTSFFIFPQPQPNTVPLYRLFNPNSVDHFYTTSAPERQNAILNDGYLSEGIAGYVFAAQQPDTIPVFRLFNPRSGDHFYTTSAAERDNAVAKDGYNNEGTACFAYGFNSYAGEGTACHVFANQAAGTAPVYRLRSSTTIDHFYTMSAAERQTAIAQYGYVDEGIACYAYPNAVPKSIPLYRAYNAKSGDHFYTTSAAERDNAVNNLGYQNEGTAANVLASPGTGTTPLLRLFGAAPAWA
ncbi:MAG TPA: hypothetical protein VFO34_15135 [Candidatus Acidoferrales bacterium]|nr:hypothetical protein [Candidatus Acidoferrales bacterium]